MGIKHPQRPDQLIAAISLTDGAVCTSGDYERRTEAGHHILEPGRREAASSFASVTVVAPSATLADALSTAAFVLGPQAAPSFLEAQGVQGLMVTREGRLTSTAGMARYLA